MSRKERERLSVFGRVKDREMSRREGAEVLGLSLRQMHRVYGRYVDEGETGLVHKSRGKASPRRSPADDRERAMALYRVQPAQHFPCYTWSSKGEYIGVDGNIHEVLPGTEPGPEPD